MPASLAPLRLTKGYGGACERGDAGVKTHVLVAVDALSDEQMRRVGAAAAGWASVERIPQDAPLEVYRAALDTAVVVMGWPQPELLTGSSVRYFQLPSVGYDAYEGKGLASKEAFTLCNARGVMSVAVAEHTLALMLTLTRKIGEHSRDAQSKVWERRETYDELYGRTVCVVGLGDIGTEIARRCWALGMRVTGVRFTPAKGHPVAEAVFGLAELEQAVANADHIINILPATKETGGLFSEQVFSAMRQGAYFYNLGRGQSVDEAALIAALESGHLAGAGLDVFEVEPLKADHPLWRLNTVLTPHVAGRSVKEFDRLADLFTENLDLFRQGKRLTNEVSLED